MLQKQEKGRGLRLKKILHISTTGSNSSTLSPTNHSHQLGVVEGNNNVTISIPNEQKRRKSAAAHEDFINKVHSINSTLPLLQIWPSQDSPVAPNAKDDGCHFKYPAIVENYNETSINCSRNSLYDQTHDQLRISDSGIDSSQTSPNPNIEISPIQSPRPACPTSPVSPITRRPGDRKKSCSLLHPDHARFLAYRQSICSDQGSTDVDLSDHLQRNSLNGVSYSSSSSQASIVATNAAIGRRNFSPALSPHHSPNYDPKSQGRLSDPWLQMNCERRYDRRRSSTMSGRLSLFDALDLEYAILQAAARGSIGPYSLRLGDSVNKLTFTQSLAFPELASKRRNGDTPISFAQNGETENCLNIFAKVTTCLVLIFISLMVFFIVYKYVKT